MFDHYTKFIKLYLINLATTNKILNIITLNYIPDVGCPKTIITDHGTQFKGRRWRDTLLEHGVKTYKTSVYHPSSNPSERVLREVGRILRTYCSNQQRKWSEYISAAEDFINLAHHQSIETTPYNAMFEKPPPREICDIIQFPQSQEYQFDRIHFHNKIIEKLEQRKRKYQQRVPVKIIQYNVGDQVLLKNRELPSTMEGITKKLLVLYIGPYTITKDHKNNTYEIADPISKKVKGTYNQASLKKYYV